MKKVIFIAGGGTGGHIYPGLALARAAQALDPEVEIHFVGTSTGLETKIIPREGYPLHLIAGGKLNLKGRWLEKMKTLVKLPWGFVQSTALILKYRPHFVLGVGGYASGPFVLMSALLGFPCGIWEPNAHPGLANRWLSRFVDICFVVFNEAKDFLKNRKMVLAGMPVRAEIENGHARAFESERFHLLCFGGSQGAMAINKVLFQAIQKNSNWSHEFQVVHQIGAANWAEYQKKYKDFESFVTPMEFIFEMPKYYAWADLVLCRGGASTLSELAAFGVVPIVIPLPGADDHQLKNALALVKADAAVLILQNELTVERLTQEVESLRRDVKRRKMMAANIKSFYKPQAARMIAQQILDLET